MKWSLTLVAILFLTVPASAQTLYWIDNGDIVKYDVPGGSINTVVAGTQAATLTVDADAGQLFWFQAPFSLMTSDLDGNNPTELVTYPFGFQDMEANPVNQRVYWINSFNGQLVSVGYDGSDPQVVGGMFFMAGIGVDPVALKFYFTRDEPGLGFRMNFDGSSEEMIIGGLDYPRDTRYDFEAGKMYWREAFTGAIQRCNNDGSGLETIIPAGAITGVTNLVLDQNQEFIYISTDNGTVWRADLDGSNLADFYTGGTDITELAIVPGSISTGPMLVRGDVNGDGSIGLPDPLFLLNSLFVPGSAPVLCADAADVDDSGTVGLPDGIFELSFLFVMGSPAIPAPNMCGEDPTDDPLDCVEFPACP